jgi:hypothetical protein
MMTAQKIAAAILLLLQVSVLSRVWDVDSVVSEANGLGKVQATNSSQAVESILRKLEPGDALRLSSTTPLGTVEVGDVAENIEVSGGFDGLLRFTGRARDWRFVYAGANTDLIIERGADLSGAEFFCSFSGERIMDYSSSDYSSIGLGMVPPPPASSLHKQRSASGCGPGPGIKWGVKTYYFDSYGTKKTWMPVYYVDMAGAPNQTDDAQVEIRGGREGGEWLFAIEANQNAGCVVLRMIDCQRLQLYSGSTEGAGNQTQGIYVMKNCEEVVLGMRRFFSNHRATSSWQGKPNISLLINGGSGNIIHNLIDIGNPMVFSLASTDPSLQIWQSFFEDGTRISPQTFECGVTHQGMTKIPSYWTEPMQVYNETILRHNGETRLFEPNPDLPRPPAFRNQPWESGSLSKRGADKGAVQVSRRFRQSKGFGAALLAAGADPTGARYSDGAFEQVMRSHVRLEIPRGRFRLREPLRARAAGLAKAGAIQTGPQYILGAGAGRTILEVDADAPAVIDLRSPGLAKSGAIESGGDMVVIDGVSLRGGVDGIVVPDVGIATVTTDFDISGYRQAGVRFEETGLGKARGTIVPPEGEAGCNDDNQADTHLFRGGSFSSGEYGIYYTGFSDKQGIDGVTFSNHSKAGIASFHSNLFHGWIKGCNFSNIEGPGVDLSGGRIMPLGYGGSYYTQWVTMIENCTFNECGSAERAALDYGMTDINMLCNSTIRTTGKQIKYGFLGSIAQMSNVDITVNASRAGVALRHPRATEASRTPLTIMHSVTCNGPLLLANGLASGERGLAPAGHDDPMKDFIYSSRLTIDTLIQEYNHSGPKWWRHGSYGWAYPRLFYNSTFNGQTLDYVLTNEWGYARDLKTGAAVDMSPVTYSGLPRGAFPGIPNQVRINGDVRTGEIPPAQQFALPNVGIDVLPAATATSAADWLDATIVGSGNEQQLSISVNTLPPSGDHTVMITVTAGNYSVAFPAYVHIEDDRRPSKVIISPKLPVVNYNDPYQLGVVVTDQFGDTVEGDHTVEWEVHQQGGSVNGAYELIAGPQPGFFGLTAKLAGSPYKDSVTFHSRYIIDNNDPGCSLEGEAWETKEQCNRYMHCAFGEDKAETDRIVNVLYREQTATGTWTAGALPPGEYELYASTNSAEEYYVNVTTTSGTEKVNFKDHRTKKYSMHDEYAKWYWLSLGVYAFDQNASLSVTLDDNLHLDRDRMRADAVMFDIPRDQWPEIDTIEIDIPTNAATAAPTLTRPRPVAAVAVYDLRGRRILSFSPHTRAASLRSLPAGNYIMLEFDPRGAVITRGRHVSIR